MKVLYVTVVFGFATLTVPLTGSAQIAVHKYAYNEEPSFIYGSL